MKILLVGHVCVDKNVVRGQTETLYGGGVVHGAITAQRLDAQAIVITKCAATDRAGYAHLGAVGVEVVFLPSPTSTSIRNVYPSENPDDRQSALISRATPFAEADLDCIAGFGADVVHVNPLWFGEFPPALLAILRRRTAFLGADAQGFLRVAQPDGRMEHRDFADKHTLLPLLDLFKVDGKEALLLTGEADPERAAQAVYALGPKLVLLTHQAGVCVCDGRATYHAPFGRYPLEGRTGRGDTCTASFLVARGRGLDLQRAANFAADITTRKMQYGGPFRG
ncbi:MAG: PfkB family carbohydrate kinase [Verrucomicrobiota bacterium]